MNDAPKRPTTKDQASATQKLLDALTKIVPPADLGLVDRLLSEGADPNGLAAFPSPLVEALEMGDYDLTSLLLERGADPNAAFEIGRTPLHVAANQGREDLVALLLSAGAKADPEWQGNPGDWARTPLEMALLRSFPEAAKLLLAAGASPNIRDPWGDAPLHAVARDGDAELAATLLSFGADPSVRNEKGLTAEEVAVGDAKVFLHSLSVKEAIEDYLSDVPTVPNRPGGV